MSGPSSQVTSMLNAIHMNGATFQDTGSDASRAKLLGAERSLECVRRRQYGEPYLPWLSARKRVQEPTDKDATTFKKAVGTDLHYFEWIAQSGVEDKLDDFKAHIEYKTLGTLGKKRFESVDVQHIFRISTDLGAVLLVDMGGGFGHDLIEFHNAFPHTPGKLVLQELPMTIKNLPKDFPREIDAQAHDAFTPQPIVGAKAYYLHMVLHELPDESCRMMLSQLVPAMQKAHSKSLLNEIVVPDVSAQWFSTSVDMLMLMCHSAQERTEGMWRDLLERVGLRISKIWDCEGNFEKIIEVKLA
ncbi:hypothetical protein SLS60_009915 [Paraconiothyrium brasiliense]|uniref:O-methyltransferase C-terminal domain-containing protein n=1 Tax=Paraconiothyrium brasiliense TaxID=300254 RepID=A0ABR3QTX6_9PLEO